MQSDLVLINATVITLDPAQPTAGWVAIRGGRIAALGRLGTQPSASWRQAEPIDCTDKTILPGFIDPHLHLLAWADNLVTVDLSPGCGIGSIADLQAALSVQVQRCRPGQWIKAKGYHEFDLAEKRHPNRWDLDLAAPDHPVKLTHRSGHAHVLNSLGLQRVGVIMESEDPNGGLIERELSTAEPTGLLYEMGGFLSGRIAPADDQTLEKGIVQVNQLLLSCGLTRVQDASARNDRTRLELLRHWQQKGLIIPNLHLMLGMQSFSTLDSRTIRALVDPQLPARLISVKIILDETTGRLLPSQKQLNEWVLAIHRAGLQAAIHAIEPPAVESACRAIALALERFPNPNHRHRIEHCSVCPPHLAKRIARLGIRVVTQPAFVGANGDRYLKTVASENIPFLYPIRWLTAQGIKVAGSSDAPVAPVSPLMAIYAAITRQTRTGQHVALSQAVDRVTALHMYTSHAAEVLWAEDIAGRITPGRPADLVVLSGNPLLLPAEEIQHLQVEMTLINGKIVWHR